MPTKKRNPLRSKILDYLSEPRCGAWTEASWLARRLGEPVKQVEREITKLTREGWVWSLRGRKGGESKCFLLNLWQKPVGCGLPGEVEAGRLPQFDPDS